MTVSDNEEGQEEYEEESEAEEPQQVAPRQGQRTMQRVRQNRQQQNTLPAENNQEMIQQAQRDERVTGNMGGRTGAIRESRIKDRPVPAESRESSLKIKIELDLEVEVDLYARVKGDVTIGLM